MCLNIADIRLKSGLILSRFLRFLLQRLFSDSLLAPIFLIEEQPNHESDPACGR